MQNIHLNIILKQKKVYKSYYKYKKNNRGLSLFKVPLKKDFSKQLLTQSPFTARLTARSFGLVLTHACSSLGTPFPLKPCTKNTSLATTKKRGTDLKIFEVCPYTACAATEFFIATLKLASQYSKTIEVCPCFLQ